MPPINAGLPCMSQRLIQCLKHMFVQHSEFIPHYQLPLLHITTRLLLLILHMDVSLLIKLRGNLNTGSVQCIHHYAAMPEEATAMAMFQILLTWVRSTFSRKVFPVPPDASRKKVPLSTVDLMLNFVEYVSLLRKFLLCGLVALQCHI